MNSRRREILDADRVRRVGKQPDVKRRGLMRWRSGLFRAWLVGSIAWVAYCAWDNDNIGCLVRTEVAPWCAFRDAKYYIGLGTEMFGWPSLTGIAILALSWVIAGFRRTTGS